MEDTHETNGGPSRLVVEGGCSIDVHFRRSDIEGLDDEQTLTFFRDRVAPVMMDNWLRAEAAVNPNRTRGGAVSCSVSSAGGGSVSCTGTFTF